MIKKENKIFRKMFIVTEYAALMRSLHYMNNIFCRILSFSHSRLQLYLNSQISIVKDAYKYVEYSHKLISIGDVETVYHG